MATVSDREEHTLPSQPGEIVVKKTTFLVNLIGLILVVVICGAFEVWYRGLDSEAGLAAVQSGVLVRVMIILAGPAIMFSLGALAGLLIAWFKKIKLRRAVRVALRVLDVLVLANTVLAFVPLLAGDAGSSLSAFMVVFLFVSFAVPVLPVFFGFAYALSLAGVDETRKPFITGPFTPDEDE